MIHNFKVENFYSISDLLELDFTSSKIDDDSVSKATIGRFVNNINCFVGNNASGKTNILKALAFFLWFSEKSFYKINVNTSIPFRQHALNTDKPTKFEIIFDNKKDELFKLEMEIFNNIVAYEELSKKTERGFSKIYSVERNNENFKTDYNNNRFMSPINKNDRDRFKPRKNSSYFSFLLGTGYLQSVNLKGITAAFFNNINLMSNFKFPLTALELSRQLEDDIEFQEFVLKNMEIFDIGIKDITFDKSKVVSHYGNQTEENRVASFKHGDDSKPFYLAIFEESEGTINAILLLNDIYNTLKQGGVAIIDEIESSIHPSIIRRLIGMFGNNTYNTKKAQLFFSTHQPLFLNDRTKKQIFLTEKTDSVNTEVYRLDEIKDVRNGENYFVKYLAGEYGAVPNFGVI